MVTKAKLQSHTRWFLTHIFLTAMCSFSKTLTIKMVNPNNFKFPVPIQVRQKNFTLFTSKSRTSTTCLVKNEEKSWKKQKLRGKNKDVFEIEEQVYKSFLTYYNLSNHFYSNNEIAFEIIAHANNNLNRNKRPFFVSEILLQDKCARKIQRSKLKIPWKNHEWPNFEAVSLPSGLLPRQF